MECEFATHSHSPDAICRYQAVLDMVSIMSHQGSLPELIQELARRLRGVFPFDLINVALHDEKLGIMRLNIWEGTKSLILPLDCALEEAPSGWAWTHQKPLVFPAVLPEQSYPMVMNILREAGIRSYCVLPLTTPHHRLGALGFASEQPNTYRDVDVEFLLRVSQLVGLAVENSLTRQALNDEKNRLRALVEVNNSLAANHDLGQLFPTISNQLRQVVAHDFAGLAVYDSKRACGLTRWPTPFPR